MVLLSFLIAGVFQSVGEFLNLFHSRLKSLVQSCYCLILLLHKLKLMFHLSVKLPLGLYLLKLILIPLNLVLQLLNLFLFFLNLCF